jgi:hypothetical protein
MTEQEFLKFIYSSIHPGMEVRKPKKISRILDVTPDGKIYYLIGTQNKKAVTRDDLCKIYRLLSKGGLSNNKIAEISGTSRPCNNTTVKWILTHFGLARQDVLGYWQATWKIK